MKVFFTIVSSKIAFSVYVFVVLQAIFTSDKALLFFSDQIKENYYYISSDWIHKIHLSKKNDYQNLFVGTSVTAFGVHPRLKDENLGLVAASANEIELILRKTKHRKMFFIELNPIAFSSNYLSVTSSFGLNSMFFSNFMISLRANIRLLKYQDILRKGIKDLFQFKSSHLDDEIKQQRNKEFIQILKGKTHLSVNPEELKSSFERSCFALSKYSLKNGFDIERLKKIKKVVEEKSDKVIYWVPLFKDSKLNEMSKSFYESVRKLFPDEKSIFYQGKKSHFFDCQHMNQTGKKALTEALYEFRN